MKEIRISKTTIDVCLWGIERYLMSKYGISQAQRDMSPLLWYVNTGRASIDFIRKLMQAKPYMIGRKLHAGGSYDEAIKRVSSYIRYTPT